ncbi:unnamed protein product [Sphagnum jensenii]|uniref:Cyanovirin-N domain-containing protein n=1 Tax=Sphagnum jensenii TaxID=128206 RepID=A0ABP1A1V3_9BRYO
MFMISSSLHQLKCSGFSIYQLLVDLSVIYTTVLLGRLVGHLNACGNFVASCNGISISGSTLSATCRDENGNSDFTELDLNPHLANINGVLEPGSGYIETCTSQGGSEEGSSFNIFAECRQENGNVIRTSFNVNNNVANINGELQWHNCNQLLAMDEIAAADEDVALSGRKLLNH